MARILDKRQIAARIGSFWQFDGEYILDKDILILHNSAIHRSNIIAKVARITKVGASDDGTKVVLGGLLDDKEIMLMSAREDVPALIVRLMQASAESAKTIGWTPKPIAGNSDLGIWMRPTQAGLIDGKGEYADSVCLAVNVGPTRLRFALTKQSASELGRTLLAASATSDSQKLN